MNRILVIFFASVALFITSCGNNKSANEAENADKEHIWKHQTDTLQNARDTASRLQQGLDRERAAMDEAGK